MNNIQLNKKLNKDDKRRFEILGLKNNGKSYDFMHIQNVSCSQLKQLAEEGFIDFENYPDDVPHIENYLNLMEKYPLEFKAHGYINSPESDDYGVVIQGIKVNYNVNDKNTLDLILDFAEINSNAPCLEISRNHLYVDWSY